MIKMDINQKFDEILFRNKVIKELSYTKAIKIVQDLEKNFMTGSKIGIYGVGIEAEGLLRFISDYTNFLKIDACFDKTVRNYKYKNIIRNTIVNPIESITKIDVDYLILGSYAYKQTFLDNLDTLRYKGCVIDLFGFMEEYIDDHFVDYKKIFQTRKDYLKASGTEKVELLQKLIKEYLLLKDFINSSYYIDIYISNQYIGYKQYEQLKKELEIFLQEIKECIRGRAKEDIIINWVDALSYYDMPDFPFLYQKATEGINFENAYTVMPWTTETTKTILFGEYPIEGRLFLKEDLSKDNVNLLKILSENGYGFGYCGMSKFAKLFDESINTRVHYYETKFSGSMQKQWDALDILCQSEIPMCILIHTLRETHEPFVCGEGNTLIYFGSTEKDWSQEICRNQVETAGKYINNQLEFYERFYSENAIEIYMSDHGRVGNSPMNEKKIHIMLSINGKKIQHETIKNMFSLVKFPDLIKKVISAQDDWFSLTEEYVLIENLDAYSELSVRDTLSGRLNRDEMYQCRGVVTMTDRYYLYAYGKEYYFKYGSDKDEIDNPIYKDRIIELKKLCGCEFINIFKYDKFKYSRQLYVNKNINLSKFSFS